MQISVIQIKISLFNNQIEIYAFQLQYLYLKYRYPYSSIDIYI